MRRRRLLHDKRGIDQIIASLLLVVIVVVASTMVFVYSTGLFGALLIAPKTATENVSLEYASFSSSNKAVTLFVRNTGSTPITMKSYYVRDSSGNVYAQTSWVAPLVPGKIQPTQETNGTVVISSACGSSCTYSGAGTGFVFVAGNVYTIVLVTAINSQFSLSVIR